MRIPWFEKEMFWRVLTNFWTGFFVAFVVANFILLGELDFLLGPMSAVYAGVLTIYVGTKEFDRWYESHEGRHPGEWFVFSWTFVIVALVASSLVLGPKYKIPSEVIAIYIAVLTLFAITQKSKSLYGRKKRD